MSGLSGRTGPAQDRAVPLTPEGTARLLESRWTITTCRCGLVALPEQAMFRNRDTGEIRTVEPCERCGTRPYRCLEVELTAAQRAFILLTRGSEPGHLYTGAEDERHRQAVERWCLTDAEADRILEA